AAVHVAGEPRVERAGRLARERVGPERDQLEPGVGEPPVERLLPGEAGGADEGGRDHLRIMHISRIYAIGRIGRRCRTLTITPPIRPSGAAPRSPRGPTAPARARC